MILEELPKLTRKERTELKKLMKLCAEDPHEAVKFDRTHTRDLTSNYYWNRFVAFGLVNSVAYNDKWNNLGEPEQLALAISDEGQHYFERYHDEQLRWVLKSALIPLIVSIVANTPNWWPMILKLLRFLR